AVSVSASCDRLAPTGTPRHTMFWYCGYFRKACDTFPVKPGYGDLIPAACAAAEFMFDCSTVAPSASTLGSFMLASTPSVEALWDRRLPRFPMYDMPSIMLPVSW